MRIAFSIFLCFILFKIKAQDAVKSQSYLDLNLFKGNIALHNNDILHLIKGKPSGFIASWNKKTTGTSYWQQLLNYPDYGYSFIYQDLKNNTLGETFGLYAHYNFYFLKRHLMLRVAQGLAYNTNPYDKLTNHKNIAFGSHLLSSTYLMINYKKEHLINRLGFQLGLSLIHYSNANFKAPNTSINTIAFNAGINYNLSKEKQEYTFNDSIPKFKEKIKYNFIFRSGINESDVIDSGQFPFYTASAYLDKRINHLSALQLGVDVFFSNFLKELIRYRSIAFPESNVSGNEDYKRVGIFVGHELFLGKLSVISQLGYYVYYPYDFEGRTYIRLGLKRYITNQLFGVVTLKSHGFRAEAVEFGLGLRL